MESNYNKLILLGSIVALIGFVLSGPVAFIIVNLIRPQPVWVSPKVFVSNYSSIQDLPFYFGFLLIGGMLMLVAGHYLNYNGENAQVKFYLLVALGWTIVFCVLILFNYICQTTFVHSLALNYKPEYDSAIETFSMSNPLSFCWANEMWGYGILGIATCLMSGYYIDNNKTIHALLIVNCIMSMLGVVFTIIDISWVITTAGFICYFIWNVLMIVLLILIYRNSKRSLQ